MTDPATDTDSADDLGLRAFHEANTARCRLWHADKPWSLFDWLTATVGELGEAANLVKKLNRHRDGVNTDRDPAAAALASEALVEVADTVTYLDLLAGEIFAVGTGPVRDLAGSVESYWGLDWHHRPQPPDPGFRELSALVATLDTEPGDPNEWVASITVNLGKTAETLGTVRARYRASAAMNYLAEALVGLEGLAASLITGHRLDTTLADAVIAKFNVVSARQGWDEHHLEPLAPVAGRPR